MKRIILIAYVLLGLYGALATWRVPALHGLRETVENNSVIPFQEYNCIRESAGDVERMAYLASGGARADDSQRFDFVMAQYVLVPTVLRSGYDGEDLAVARFTRRSELAQALDDHRLEVVRACGSGVYLLKRAATP